ncbi:MAG TPA: ABC transporter permease [Gemmatimonadaceae bacterium]|nr:ABC transporter permease [Gemmatimonadaceae bacterium]
MRNLKLAFRTLFKTPFVTAVAILSLALGIGANAAIFSLFDELLLRPLPVRDPGQLVNLGAPGPKPGSQSCGQAGDCDEVFSYQMFRDLEHAPADRTPFSGIAAHVAFGANLAYGKQTPTNGEGMLVSGSYFPVLGLRPALGRLLGPADDQNIGGHYVAVLSHGYWENQLGADPGVLGKPIVVNGQSLTIVGVAPRGFEGTTLGSNPRVFVPLTMRAQMLPGWRGFDNRQSYWAYLFARLKPGVSVEQATRAINAIYRPIITDVEAPLQKGMSDATMAKFRTKEITVEPGQRGQSSVHQEARTPLIMLFAITGIVLLIACANIANLLLARGANRSMEMAVRLSLGASRRQVLAQLLTESCVLAVLGGIASLLVARWTLSLIASILPPESAATLHLAISLPVVLFAGALSIGTGLLFGMFPALHSTRPDLVTTIRANAGQLHGARSATRFRTSLVTAQIALSMALLISAGLFIKSLVNVSRVDLGLEIEHVLTFGLSPELSGYEPGRSQVFFRRVEAELATIPGVTGVTAARVPLLAGSNWGNDVSVQGFKKGPDTDANARFNEVGPGYFRTLGVPLLSGREFTEADVAGAPKVAIVNEAFAKKFGLGREAVGKYMSMGGETLDMQIVGLVQDAKYSEVKDEIPPLFFTAYRQDSTIGSMSFYVRTSLPPEQLLRTIPSVIARLDPNLPVEQLKTMPQQVRENVFLDRMISTLSAAFAVLATLLAAVGLYGVLAYTVAQRTREIGVRMALGADGRHVQGLVLKQVGVMLLVGGLVGIGGALALGRAAQSLLFGLEGHDPTVMVAATVVLALVALGAGYVPALRASKVDPVQALRYE